VRIRLSTSRLEQLAYADKPPLFMWAVALFVQLAHLPKVALYLPALLASAVVISSRKHDEPVEQTHAFSCILGKE
jgi:hypothetical protein